MADWVNIKAEYLVGNSSLRELAEKHGVSFSSLGKKAVRERWKDERTETGNRVATKVKQKLVAVSVAKEVDRLTRLLSIGDKLAAKLDEAAGQLDQKIVTHKRKTKTMEYGDEPVCRKPLVETTVEEEFLAFVDAPIDRQGVKQLASALKDLNDIAATPKTDEQSLSKVAEMMSRLDKEAASDAVPE